MTKVLARAHPWHCGAYTARVFVHDEMTKGRIVPCRPRPTTRTERACRDGGRAFSPSKTRRSRPVDHCGAVTCSPAQGTRPGQAPSSPHGIAPRLKRVLVAPAPPSIDRHPNGLRPTGLGEAQ